MVNRLVIILFVFLHITCTHLSAQTNIDWKIKTALSAAIGFQTENTQEYFFQGALGFKPKNSKIELRGDLFYFMTAKGDRPRFQMNHQLFAGAAYRFSVKLLQPYVGLQPGIAYSQSSEYGALNETTGEIEYEQTINPIGSVFAGIEIFNERLFYGLIETRYVAGKHMSNSYPIFLDEFRISFGLGIHF